MSSMPVVFEHLDLAAEVVVSHPPRALRQVEVGEHPVAGGDAFGIIVLLGFGEHLAGLVNRRIGLVLLDIIGNQAARPDEVIEIAQVLLGMLAAEFLHAPHAFEDFSPVVLVVEMVETDAKRDSLHAHVARNGSPPEERIAHGGSLGTRRGALCRVCNTPSKRCPPVVKESAKPVRPPAPRGHRRKQKACRPQKRREMTECACKK